MWVTSKMQHLGLRTTNLDAAQDLNHSLTQGSAAKLTVCDGNTTGLGTGETQVSKCDKLSSNEMFWCIKTPTIVFSVLGNDV